MPSPSPRSSTPSTMEVSRRWLLTAPLLENVALDDASRINEDKHLGFLCKVVAPAGGRCLFKASMPPAG